MKGYDGLMMQKGAPVEIMARDLMLVRRNELVIDVRKWPEYRRKDVDFVTINNAVSGFIEVKKGGDRGCVYYEIARQSLVYGYMPGWSGTSAADTLVVGWPDEGRLAYISMADYRRIADRYAVGQGKRLRVHAIPSDERCNRDDGHQTKTSYGYPIPSGVMLAEMRMIEMEDNWQQAKMN